MQHKFHDYIIVKFRNQIRFVLLKYKSAPFPKSPLYPQNHPQYSLFFLMKDIVPIP